MTDHPNRYSSQTGYPPVAPSRSSTSSPLYAPVSQPTPPHLIHSRYSSADLYAIPNSAGGGGEQAGERGTPPLLEGGNSRPYRDEPDSDSDSDSDSSERGGQGGGGGFGTYRDFGSLRPGGNPRRISQAPTLSTLPRAAGGSTYQLKEHASTITSTTKLETMTPGGGGAYETVAVPKISGDWGRGEGLNEKNYKKYEKSRNKRRQCTGFLGKAWDKAVKKWKIVVPVLIAFIIALILVLYFCIPRTPSVTFRHPKVPSKVLTSTDESPYITSTDPVSFYFNANLIFALDASKSYVPVHYSSFGIKVKLRETGDVIGSTTWDQGEIKIPGKKVTSYEFPINFAGNYTSTSDPTFAIMKSSCSHLYPTTYRAPLNLTVEVSSKIMGVIGTGSTEASIANVVCPIEWSSSAN